MDLYVFSPPINPLSQYLCSSDTVLIVVLTPPTVPTQADLNSKSPRLHLPIFAYYSARSTSRPGDCTKDNTEAPGIDC